MGVAECAGWRSLSLLQGQLEACRMEGASKEKLASVSNLVTVFENNRYGVVGVGRSNLANW